MKALVLHGPFDIRLEEVSIPEIKMDEVLIQIKACSICGSDIHGYDGSNSRRIPPIIMGHEASGVIVKIGSEVAGWKVGDRVTFDSTEYCGECWYCKQGDYNLCIHRKIIGVSCEEYKKNGAMAEYIVVKAHILYRIPDNVTFQEACLCEPLSVGMHAVRLSALKERDTALIIGAGTIGLMTLLAVRSVTKGFVLSSVRYERQREMALKLGASGVVMEKQSVQEIINGRTVGNGVDVVYDTVGTQESLQCAFEAVRTGGTIVCVGNNQAEINFPLQKCVINQISVLGSYSSSGEFESSLKKIASGEIDLSLFTNDLFSLKQGVDAFRKLSTKGHSIQKAIVVFGEFVGE